MKKAVSLILACAMSASLVACGAPSPKNTGSPAPDAAKTGTGIDLSQKEAPQLAQQVKAGTLPALEKRMPPQGEAMVEPDIQSLGKYGGSLAITMSDNGRWNWGPYTEQSLFRFKQDNSGEVEANICKEFSANDDATVWTVKLREGMKWSDGEPLTADDFIFYYDHMSTPALNADRTAKAAEAADFYGPYTSKTYHCYQAEKDGKKYWAELKKVNDYEYTVTFAAPKPSFAADVAVDNKWGVLPKHFFIKYVSRKDGVTDDTAFPAITEQEALANANTDFGMQWDSYSTMGKSIGYYNWDYALVPQLRSFIATKDNWNKVGETYELVRNPYFWKTDSEGRQLPYLDSIKVKIINEKDQATLQAMSGEFDMYNTNTYSDYSTVATALKDTHTLNPWVSANWMEGSSEGYGIQLNQTVKDLDKRALFQDKRFREALSICVDRNLMNETLLNGVSEPYQASPVGYDEEWSKKWTEFDTDKANKLMDEITEPWDRKDGTYRKMKGAGKDAEIILSLREPSISGDFVSLLQASYQSIGVKLSTKVDADLRTTMLSNDVEATTEVIQVSTPAIRPDALVPMRNFSVWYSAYGKWYEDGKSEANGGIAPTGDVLELVRAYEAMQGAAGPNRDKIIAENVEKIYDLHKENVWILSYLQPLPYRFLVNNDLKNVPENMMMVDEYRFESIARPEQFWWDK